ncbi:MAG: site-2 protease family protein [Solirubrobacteraceae bacterium]
MSYVLAALGFAVLIIAHEAGHFAVGKAVGMRVERFSLFFGPLIAKVRRGETEYGIGVIPLGGYVKITGMNPHEEIPPEVQARAYYNQPVWKRVVTILAGPAVNILIAFFIIWGLLLADGQTTYTPNTNVAAVEKASPAAGSLRPGDQVVAVDGVGGSEAAIHKQIQTHRCAGAQVAGCLAATPAHITVKRDGRLATLLVRPRYETEDGQTAMLVGVDFGTNASTTYPSFIGAASDSVSGLWSVTTQTVSTVARIFEPKERKQLSGVVGVYTVTQESVATSAVQTLKVLALISLSLGIINLFPFLPLDGGHVFWALAEKVRGRRIPFSVMERAGMVGFALILVLFVIGLSNDISALSGGGLKIH